MIPTVTWPRANARRLDRHRLTAPGADGSAPAALAAVARAKAGVHAQIPSAAEVSLARRTDAATRAEVRRALWEDGTLARTFGPRGTVHLLPAGDLGRWCAGLSAIPGRSAFPDGVRLTPDQAEQVVAAAGTALADDDLTIDELSEAVIATTGPWAGDLVMPAFGGFWPRWRQALSTVAHRGLLCFGPDRGRKVTYTSPLRRGADVTPVAPEVGVGHLVDAYLRAFGPATPAAFARWVSAPRAWSAEALAAHGGPEVHLDGETARLAPSDTAFDGPGPPRVVLLPYFDAFVVGSQPRGRLYPGPAAERALSPSGQAGNFPVVLVDGLVGGVWHPRRSGRRVAVTVELLAEISARHRRALDDEVDRLGEIIEATPTLTLGPVAVGPHA